MLPAHLAERLEPNAPAPRADGDYVVYWMRIAARATENPALDVALAAAAALKKPVFVYHALSERYRYASDRLHTFILEGARDAHRELAARGIGAVFHLERRGHDRPVLRELAARAALVVTDFMPVQPLLRWDAEVARAAPLWRVDASCLAPVWALSTAHERAYTFGHAAAPLWERALSQPWRDVEPAGPAWLPALPFAPLDLAAADVPALVAACDLDHGIGPVHHTPGGSVAGLARWARFLETRLDDYAKDRNDPVRDGTSRLSAYLHFGHVSPFRLAREAAARRTDGAEKWLDELLTWRELAWHYCLHHPNHESVEALPAWARQTLAAHERDPRPALPSWEQLARAQTGDLLWDAAQRQLLAHGELHNSVRMTWGKALLGWSRTAQEALALLVDLNHRYALDGRDPASYGGILWCLGALDRPFSPEQPVFGAVRPRSTAEHAKRFDVGEYERRVHRPSRGTPLTVAVIGAGVAGAACARALRDAGHVVTVFDKGRGPGGRASTRRHEALAFDHGAPCFTVHDECFARWARAWWQERVLAEWKPRLEVLGPPIGSPAEEGPRLVAQPGMSALLSRMLLDVDVRSGVEVKGLTRDGPRWRLLDAAGHALGEYEVAVVATPAPQAAALVDPTSYALASRLREVVLAPAWVVMAHLPEASGLEWDAAVSTLGPLAWLAKQSSKPGRAPVAGESWVLHASAEWSRAHLEEAPGDVVPQLMDAFLATTGARRVEPAYAAAHRWRYARVERPLGEPCAWEPGLGLAVCGDWCLGPGVEAAFLSGSAAAGRINALPGSGEVEEPPARRAPGRQLTLGLP